MPNTTSFDFADVVLVPFPFTDQSTTKKRPAVVISSEPYHRQRYDLTTIETGLVLRIMGKLHADDRGALRKALDNILGE